MIAEFERLREYAMADSYCPCCGDTGPVHAEGCDYETDRMREARSALASGTGNAGKKDGGK